MKRLVIALFVAALPAVGTAADTSRVLFMELPNEVLPSDVGSSAFSIVGSFRIGGAFSWMPTGGTVPLGGTAGVTISRDGRTIIGNTIDSSGRENAAIWQGGRNWQPLGSFTSSAQACDRSFSAAYGASDDGRVIVGLAWDGCRYAHAFRWESSTGMVDLGTLNANSTRANNVSGDGKVVVGWQEDVTGVRTGAKWVNGREELVTGPSSRPVGEAMAANRDGSVIVGKICDFITESVVSKAWTWTADKGVTCFPVTRPSTLPNLPYTTTMMSTSDDGRVIGGAFTFGLDSEALLWIDGQSYFLKDYLIAHGYPDAFKGWINTGFITGVSADGRTLVGYGAGPTTFKGYVVILPPGGVK